MPESPGTIAASALVVGVFVFLLVAGPAGPVRATGPDAPLPLGTGPHLFLDDHLVESTTHLVRRLMAPRREPANPLISGEEDGNFQPYVTVLRDPETKRFRAWYNIQVDGRRRSRLGYLESADGVRWHRPHRELNFPFSVTYGVSILDEGPDYPDPDRRFKYAYYHSGGLRLAVSPDGLEWTSFSPDVLVPGTGDINNLFHDPIRNRYAANVKLRREDRDWLGQRWRLNGQSTSEDLVEWTEPRVTIDADERDLGETQFYCMGGVLARGDLLIGMVRVLRDDLPAEPHGEVACIGYTTLAWSRDGETWIRDREPFLDRSPVPGAWDRAMAWVDCQLPVGDEVYLYYGGYARGHKIERNTERQIGLARIGRDRYIAREAGAETGRLVTRPVVLHGDRLTLNTDAAGGQVRVRVLDLDGNPHDGLDFSDTEPVTVDAIDVPIAWNRPLSELDGTPIRLEFRLRRAQLFAFKVLPDRDD